MSLFHRSGQCHGGPENACSVAWKTGMTHFQNWKHHKTGDTRCEKPRTFPLTPWKVCFSDLASLHKRPVTKEGMAQHMKEWSKSWLETLAELTELTQQERSIRLVHHQTCFGDVFYCSATTHPPTPLVKAETCVYVILGFREPLWGKLYQSTLPERRWHMHNNREWDFFVTEKNATFSQVRTVPWWTWKCLLSVMQNRYDSLSELETPQNRWYNMWETSNFPTHTMEGVFFRSCFPAQATCHKGRYGTTHERVWHMMIEWMDTELHS